MMVFFVFLSVVEPVCLGSQSVPFQVEIDFFCCQQCSAVQHQQTLGNHDHALLESDTCKAV